ncbi:ABC transporter permease [Geomicrobium sp. JCM 19039]|uniref:ABC transporter permease n=1 Tax=Geomicrobium sp. JCM 19039 TaxID=1460636 RepID=UPI00045F119E|nr:ABC transporter permease [Geomicrobium sp. JCM 19039]GAK14035.1 ABC transport system, permease component YbhR [Geomicrobium sp. JCM 19039]
MRGILWQLTLLTVRNPWTLLAMLFVTILFATVTGLEETERTSAFVYNESMEEAFFQSKVEQLQSFTDEVSFEILSQEEREIVRTRQTVDAIFGLYEDDYIVEPFTTPSMTEMSVAPVLDQFYIMTSLTGETVEKMEALDSVFEVETSYIGIDNSEPFNNTVKNMFGWALFFVIYTIAFSVSDILQLRSRRIWDRIILSPSSKWSIYSSYLLVVFLIGYVQVMTALTIFHYLFDFPFYGGYWLTYIAVIPYLFAVMAVGIFLSSLITNLTQLSGLVMLFAMGSGMLGGAFWPLHVTGDFMYALSYLSPVRYGMELLYGVTLYDWSFDEFLLPVSILVFIGCTFTALGIHFMERRGDT